MHWELYRWVWQLQSPLFIGSTPAGMLNRCRLYVPARAMWGAMTAEIARSQNGGGHPKYKEIGLQLKEEVRFSYLYPAEFDGKEWREWLPTYAEKGSMGLVWRREGTHDDALKKSDREMRFRLLHTRPSTSINPDTYAAEDGSLRETECIQTFWRNNSSDLSPVAMVGYFFIKSPALLEKMEKIRMIFLGGDTRYGLGRLKRMAWSKADAIFNMKPSLEEQDPVIAGKRILAHSRPADQSMRGALEVLFGWDKNAPHSESQQAKPWFVPGSYCETSEDESKLKWTIDQNGLWQGKALE
ncbi:MAG: hypothetical protein IMX04_08870 [Candidatus Carbobacillus altaicus]|uniref:DUF324 domain containing Cmr6-like protein n=1 Tax=Candidatus Carbonibacillus altaicus TaxID=2163959 RepID=A0A2R6Y3N0_9BACL|nr:hypothetical protein [Candidatus Carbobacillus altaicus]PTQ57294.1 MAG: DUF324 domain containing Cmr6-like protein [Candidatus Carbobacillus altaicus]